MLSEVKAADKQDRIALFAVTPEAVAATRTPPAASFPPSFRAARLLDYERFAPGDAVDVVIWERDDFGLFTSSPSPGLVGGGAGAGGSLSSSSSSGGLGGSSGGAGAGASGSASTTQSQASISGGGASPGGITGNAGSPTGGASDLGAFTVSRDGAIRLPFIGTLQVAGLTPEEARGLLLKRLRGLVIASDVRLAPTQQRGELVTIQGDVTRAGVYPIGQGMQRLSALLSQAAPDQTNPEQTTVTVRRGGVAATVRLVDIYRDPAQDIALVPSDSIVVRALQDYVTVVGAAGGQGHAKITKRNYSVLDAVADVRGLADSTADPRAVFLIRPGQQGASGVADGRPPVYQFNMREPDQVLMAGQFAVQDGDVVFISDAPFAQIQKALSALTATLGTARSVTGLSQ